MSANQTWLGQYRTKVGGLEILEDFIQLFLVDLENPQWLNGLQHGLVWLIPIPFQKWRYHAFHLQHGWYPHRYRLISWHPGRPQLVSCSQAQSWREKWLVAVRWRAPCTSVADHVWFCEVFFGEVEISLLVGLDEYKILRFLLL